jgi:hypothetical protein
MYMLIRCVRGWHLGRSLERELTLTSLERALEAGFPEIHHSDQPAQPDRAARPRCAPAGQGCAPE